MFYLVHKTNEDNLPHLHKIFGERLVAEAVKNDEFREWSKTIIAINVEPGFTESDTLPIHDLPKELIHEISAGLPLETTYNLYRVNKKLFAARDRTRADEKYWQSAPKELVLQTVTPIFSYKKRCLSLFA